MPTSLHTTLRWPLVRVLGCCIMTAGFIIPLAATFSHGIADLQLTVLTLGLCVISAVAANVKFSIGFQDITIVPVTAPLIFAAIMSEPQQAMVVALFAFLPNIEVLRNRRILPNIQSAGLGAITIGVTSLVAHGAGASFTHPGIALVSGAGCTALFICMEFVVYATWDWGETGSALAMSRYYKSAGPIDAAMTATAVMLAAPFYNNPGVVFALLGGYTLAVTAIYRLTASEHLHRTQSAHLRDVFSRYVPESVADRLADATHEIELGGETREVSVLFCDIRGFTAWSEQHEASVVVQQLNVLLGSLTEAVMRHEGTLDKFTGDGLMAFWGAPLEQPDHAELACRAAADIHAALFACNELREAEGMPPFEIGVGVATGPAVVGNIGHEKRLDYTAIGDTVNLSARLEAATKEVGKATVISEATAALLPDTVRRSFRPLAPISVKGKREPVQIHGGDAAAGSADAKPALSLVVDQAA